MNHNETLQYVRECILEEGLGYAFVDYHDYAEVKDDGFQELRQKFQDAYDKFEKVAAQHYGDEWSEVIEYDILKGNGFSSDLVFCVVNWPPSVKMAPEFAEALAEVQITGRYLEDYVAQHTVPADGEAEWNYPGPRLWTVDNPYRAVWYPGLPPRQDDEQNVNGA